jgi:hypothetical protein
VWKGLLVTQSRLLGLVSNPEGRSNLPPIKRYGFFRITTSGFFVFLAMATASALGGCDGRTNVPEEATGFAEPVYVIEGSTVRLDDDVYFGEDGTVSLLRSVRADLNNDTLDDLAAVLRLDSKGSGIFYYLNVFLADRDGRLSLVGAQFLGDRIKLDFIEIYGEASISSLTGVPIHADDYGQLAVGYSSHAAGQAFTEQPSLYITRHWKVSEGKLVSLENY